MSEKVVFSVKMLSDQKAKATEILENYSESKHLDKGDALYRLMMLSTEKIAESTGENVSKKKPIDCNFLMYDSESDEWVCLENIARNKKPSVLGMDGIKVKQLCQACFDKRNQDKRNEEMKILQKKGFDRLAQFYKQFQIITDNGLNAYVRICNCDDFEKFSISRNGHTLNCPQQNDEIVTIEEVCMNKIDPTTSKRGCPWLVSIDSIVNLKDTTQYKDLVRQFPELENKSNEE